MSKLNFSGERIKSIIVSFEDFKTAFKEKQKNIRAMLEEFKQAGKLQGGFQKDLDITLEKFNEILDKQEKLISAIDERLSKKRQEIITLEGEDAFSEVKSILEDVVSQVNDVANKTAEKAVFAL